MIRQVKNYLKEKIFGNCEFIKNIEEIEMTNFFETFRPLTIVYPVYITNKKRINNVIKSLKIYENLTVEQKKKLYIILVDDASTVKLELPEFDLNLTVLRIQKNIKWNSGGAKNLGVLSASTERIIISDIDHWFPAETLSFCMRIKNLDNKVFAFNQHEFLADGTESKNILIHPNIFFLSKTTYLMMHGYDEDFCGYYGDDIFFRKYLSEMKKIEVYNSGKISYVKTFDDSHNLKRKLNCRFLLFRKGLRHSKDMLRFPWELVYSWKIDD